MRYLTAFIITSTLLLLFSGCIKNINLPLLDKPTEYSPATYEDLAPVTSLAINLNSVIKNGIRDLTPYVNINQDNLVIDDFPAEVRETNILVIGAGYDQQNIYNQRLLTESVDPLGRFDLRDDSISFYLRDTDKQEALIIAENVRELVKASAKTGAHQFDRTAFKDRVKAYQRDCAIEEDGIFGKNTAQCIGQKTPVIDVLSLSSTVVYPKRPRAAIYVLPAAVVEANSGKYYKGFDSLAVVQADALNPESFKSQAVEGARFVVFVYFFDRVAPGKPIALRISPFSKRYDGEMGEAWYAEPGKWPVVVESFTIDKVTEDDLFVNVFLGKNFSIRCVASHQIQRGKG